MGLIKSKTNKQKTLSFMDQINYDISTCSHKKRKNFKFTNVEGVPRYSKSLLNVADRFLKLWRNEI